MKYTGYHRTSTKEQHLDRGIKEIQDFCDERNIKLHKNKVYTDQQTGKNFHRTNYRILKEEVLESGDTLLITEIDRLGRNKALILEELRYYKENDIRVMILELPTTLMDINGIDNDMAVMMLETINNMMIELYASIAQSEIEKKEKRQREGIKAMKDRNEWERYGRPRNMKFNEFTEQYKRVLRGEIRPYALMNELNLDKSSYYRYKKEYDRKEKEKKKERANVFGVQPEILNSEDVIDL